MFCLVSSSRVVVRIMVIWVWLLVCGLWVLVGRDMVSFLVDEVLLDVRLCW